MKIVAIIGIAIVFAMLAAPVSAGTLALTSPHGMDSMKIDEGQAKQLQVGVHNEGTAQISVKMSAEGTIAPHITFSHQEFDLEAGDSKSVTISIEPLQEGVYGGTITATQMVSGSSDGGTAMHAGISLSAPIQVTAGEPSSEENNENIPPDDNSPQNDNGIPDDGGEIPPSGSSSLSPLGIVAAVLVGIACVVVLVVPRIRRKQEVEEHVD